MAIGLFKWHLLLDGIFLQKRYIHFAERQCFTEHHSGNFGSGDSKQTT